MATPSTTARPPRARQRTHERVLWVTPVLVWFVVARPVPLPYVNPQLGLAAVVGALAAVALHRRPALCLRVLFALLPFSSFVLAYLHQAGAPRALVGRAGLWDELVVGSVALAALRHRRAHPLPVDLLDKLAIGYVVLSVVYLLDPGLLLAGTPGAGLGFGQRFFGIRSDVLFVVLLLALRHSGITLPDTARAVRYLLLSFSVVGALAVVEFLVPERWHEFVTIDLDYLGYLRQVIGVSGDVIAQTTQVLRNRADATLPRVGSVLLHANDLAFSLLVPFAVAVEALVQGRRTRLAAVAAGLTGAGLLLAQTRSVLGAAALVLVLAARRQPGRSEAARVRAQSFIAIVLVAALPLIVAAGLFGRFGDSEQSDDLHVWSLTQGIETIVERPLGLGLATGAGGGARLELDDRVKSENQYLQIGTQMGVVGMGLFVAVVVTTVRLLRRRAEEVGGGDVCVVLLGARAALIGLAFVGLFLQPFASTVPAYLAWGLAGAALAAAEHSRRRAPAAA